MLIGLPQSSYAWEVNPVLVRQAQDDVRSTRSSAGSRGRGGVVSVCARSGDTMYRVQRYSNASIVPDFSLQSFCLQSPGMRRRRYPVSELQESH